MFSCHYRLVYNKQSIFHMLTAWDFYILFAQSLCGGYVHHSAVLITVIWLALAVLFADMFFPPHVVYGCSLFIKHDNLTTFLLLYSMWSCVNVTSCKCPCKYIFVCFVLCHSKETQQQLYIWLIRVLWWGNLLPLELDWDSLCVTIILQLFLCEFITFYAI